MMRARAKMQPVDVGGAESAALTEFRRSLEPVYDRLVGRIRLPLEEAPHVATWRAYRAAAVEAPWEFLQARVPQWNIPVQEGISGTESYGRVARRGEPFNVVDFGERLLLRRPDLFDFRVEEHWASALPVLSTSDRGDFETLYRVLGHRNEPVEVALSVNAQLVAGYINWSRVLQCRDAWLAGGGLPEDWSREMARRAKESPASFRDTIVLLHPGAYSGVSAGQLGLDLDEAAWRDVSSVLRLEHELTHHATKRLFGQTRLHVWEELVCDFMGMTKALGAFRASWFLTFMGLEAWPRVRADGRLHTYTQCLSHGARRVAAELLRAAAMNLELLWTDLYDARRRVPFYLALMGLSLEEIAHERVLRTFPNALAASWNACDSTSFEPR